MNLFVALSDRNWPSSRIRAWSISDYWDQAHCCLRSELGSVDLNKYQNIVLQKVYDVEALELAKKYNVYLDICDPVWMEPQIREYVPYLKGVVASSQALADDFTVTFGLRAICIKDRFPYTKDQRTHEEVEAPVLVWFGMSGNRRPCLDSVALNIRRLLFNNIKFKLLIIDDHPEVPYVQENWCRHVQWNLSTFSSTLARCDIALLPDRPDPWGVVKSENKVASASWAGLPIVNGMDYFDILHYIEDLEDRSFVGGVNRRNAESEYIIDKSVEEWKELLS
jgi:hypothetical protein